MKYMDEKLYGYEGKIYTLKFEGMDIPYEICINKRLKYLKVIMGKRGMTVFVPFMIDPDEIDRFLKTKGRQICDRYNKILSVYASAGRRKWDEGEKLMLKGETYEMRIHDASGDKAWALFDGMHFNLYINSGIIGHEREEKIEDALKKLYTAMAKEIVPERVRYLSVKMGISYNNIRIKDVKTRWGSCSQKGNLSFNWRIVMAPSWIMDYVIVHELCHIIVMNHSKCFWDMVMLYTPRYEEARRWLDENGFMLNI